MRYAVLSDVHANLTALNRTLADARGLGCARFVFVGDVTGYGVDAKGALAAVRENFDVAVLGNHDAVCCGMDWRAGVTDNPNYDLDRIQSATLTDDEREWLCGLPVVHAEKGMAFAHGDFTNPKGWRYVLEAEDVVRCMSVREEKVLFCGHTHVAAIWEYGRGGQVRRLCAESLMRPPKAAETVSLALEGGSRYLVNCGSVGCARVDKCIEYAVIDEGRAIGIRRLPLDEDDGRVKRQSASV